jgi:hypothetical protein
MQDITEWGIVMSMFPYLLFILTATFDLKFKKKETTTTTEKLF